MITALIVALCLWFTVFPIITTILCFVSAAIENNVKILDVPLSYVFDGGERPPLSIVIVGGPITLAALAIQMVLHLIDTHKFKNKTLREIFKR